MRKYWGIDCMSSKIRIAHVISALGKGGMEFAVSRLALEQKKMGYPVHVICLREFGPTKEILEAGGVPVHLSCFRSRLDPGSLFRLRGLLQKLGVNVVQTHNYRPNVSGTVAAKMAGIPAIISTLRTINRWDTPRQFWMDRFLCFFRDAIVCVSREVRDQYIEKIKCSPGKLHVIHNGIDPGLLLPLKKAEHLYTQYGLNKDNRHLISIARLVKIKDHSTLLKAQKKIIAEKNNVCLLILGDGPLKEELELQVKELGLVEHVRFLGHQDNIAEWLSISDISILSTHIEGFSSTVLESMAAGVPMIATGVGGNFEAIQDGITGFLIPHGDADHLARTTLRLLDDPGLCREISQNAGKVVEQSFTIEITARKTVDLYKTILRRKGRLADVS